MNRNEFYRFWHEFQLAPGYLLYRASRRFFPRQHPWRDPIIPFHIWVRCSTDLNRLLSVGIGYSFIILIAMLGIIILRLLR